MKKIFSKKNKNFFCFKRIIIFIFLLSFLLRISNVCISKDSGDSIIYISKSGLGNFTTIQEGIDEAESGDTLFVYNGTYFENLVIDKSIILTGENKNNTIIDGRVAGNAIKINSNNVTIKNFTIMHSGLIYPNSGINISSNFNLIENNLITDNFYGITLYFALNNTIRKNTIQNDDHCGIYISKSKNNSIIGNIIQNNFYNGVGLYYSSDNNIIRGNNLINNGFCGVNIRICSNNKVVNNNFSENNMGIYLPNSPNTARNNTFYNNKIDIEQEFLLSEVDTIYIITFFIIIVFIILIFIITIIKKRRLK